MTIRVLYLASLREALGAEGESLALGADTRTVADVVVRLRERGGAWREAFDGRRIVRCAVNHEMAGPLHALHDGDELAFFPPVTGG